MMNLQSKLSELSHDEHFENFVSTVLEILEGSGVPFFIFGSTGLIARLQTPHRVPGDIDIGIVLGGLEKLHEPFLSAGFTIVARSGFAEISNPKMRCHIVENCFDLISPEDKKIMGTYDFRQTFKSTEIVCLRLTFFKGELMFPCPSSTETLFLCLLKPLNTTTVRDFCYFFESHAVSVDLFVEISNRSREAAIIVKERLRLLAFHCPTEARKQVLMIVDAIP